MMKNMIRPNLRLKEHEIADRLGITTRAVRSHVKLLIKARICHADYSAGGEVHGLETLPIWYDIEWLIAIAYRVATPEAQRFREELLANIFTLPLVVMLK
ncbi:MAG: hypothetical protein SNH79_01085 [Rikenellaceae bacterium]